MEQEKNKTINVELLLKVKQQILDHPESLDMKEWFNPKDCGTTACIAGHAVLLGGLTIECGFVCAEGHLMDKSISEAARSLLGLDYSNYKWLFHDVDWPEPYSRLYDDAKTAEERAIITASRIDHFIATKGRE